MNLNIYKAILLLSFLFFGKGVVNAAEPYERGTPVLDAICGTTMSPAYMQCFNRLATFDMRIIAPPNDETENNGISIETELENGIYGYINTENVYNGGTSIEQKVLDKDISLKSVFNKKCIEGVDNDCDGYKKPKIIDSDLLLDSAKKLGVMNKPKGSEFKLNRSKQEINPSVSVRTCNRDGKQCSDGSIVGRAGSKCEFTKCPE